jgi:DNA-binding PadR family transcriptional regulator
MQSSVNWALLGLIIERPSYAYELAQRFERTYEGALSLSSVSHVYTAIGTLKSRALIIEVPGTRKGRQPKPLYRATPRGVHDYRDWLVHQVEEDSRRRRLFVLQLAALTREPEAALATLDRYQQACLREAAKKPIGEEPGAESDAGAVLRARLLAEDARLEMGARLSWVEYAREQLRASTEGPKGQR